MSNKFKSEFETVLNSLEDVGYNNYYKILKSSNYGLPQARERVFIVSIRKDIDKGFVFPKPIKLEKTLYECLDFRDNKDDLTKSFYNFYKEKINNLASYEDFIKYIEQIPIKEKKYILKI
jgi:Site-specific DNA methylase